MLENMGFPRFLSIFGFLKSPMQTCSGTKVLLNKNIFFEKSQWGFFISAVKRTEDNKYMCYCLRFEIMLLRDDGKEQNETLPSDNLLYQSLTISCYENGPNVEP